jgi:hypothetical protein
MTTNLYKSKILKYKNKYISLQKMIGGSDNLSINSQNQIIDRGLEGERIKEIIKLLNGVNRINYPVTLRHYNIDGKNIYLFGDKHFSLDNSCIDCVEPKCLDIFELINNMIRVNKYYNRNTDIFLEKGFLEKHESESLDALTILINEFESCDQKDKQDCIEEFGTNFKMHYVDYRRVNRYLKVCVDEFYKLEDITRAMIKIFNNIIENQNNEFKKGKVLQIFELLENNIIQFRTNLIKGLNDQGSKIRRKILQIEKKDKEKVKIINNKLRLIIETYITDLVPIMKVFNDKKEEIRSSDNINLYDLADFIQYEIYQKLEEINLRVLEKGMDFYFIGKFIYYLDQMEDIIIYVGNKHADYYEELFTDLYGERLIEIQKNLGDGETRCVNLDGPIL